MDYVNISKLYESLWFYYDADMLTSEIEKGCKQNILNYLEHFAPDNLKKENDEIFVNKKLLTTEFFYEYLNKRKGDCNSNDCAHIALSRIGIPPIGDMSVKSLGKTISDKVFPEMKSEGKVYIKRISTNKDRNKYISTYCVDYYTADMIAKHPKVVALIKKQARKAEREKKDTVEWKAYEFEKQKIALLDSSEEYYNQSLMDERTFLMVEAIYNQLFSELDYKKYVEYRNEMEMLYEEWDFGERFQELYNIMHSPKYNNEFYKFMPKKDIIDGLLDVLAEKIAKKIIEKRS